MDTMTTIRQRLLEYIKTTRPITYDSAQPLDIFFREAPEWHEETQQFQRVVDIDFLRAYYAAVYARFGNGDDVARWYVDLPINARFMADVLQDLPKDQQAVLLNEGGDSLLFSARFDLADEAALRYIMQSENVTWHDLPLAHRMSPTMAFRHTTDLRYDHPIHDPRRVPYAPIWLAHLGPYMGAIVEYYNYDDREHAVAQLQLYVDQYSQVIDERFTVIRILIDVLRAGYDGIIDYCRHTHHISHPITVAIIQRQYGTRFHEWRDCINQIARTCQADSINDVPQLIRNSSLWIVNPHFTAHDKLAGADETMVQRWVTYLNSSEHQYPRDPEVMRLLEERSQQTILPPQSDIYDFFIAYAETRVAINAAADVFALIVFHCDDLIALRVHDCGVFFSLQL